MRLRRMVVGSVSEEIVRNLCEAAVLVVPLGWAYQGSTRAKT